MTQMLELSDRKFITMINMLKTLMENVDSMYGQMIISEERRKIIMSHIEMSEMKNIVINK